MLFAAYATTILFTLPLGFFFFLGLFETARSTPGNGPLSGPGPGQNSNT
jgi:hypothetical protein